VIGKLKASNNNKKRDASLDRPICVGSFLLLTDSLVYSRVYNPRARNKGLDI
jgi:hypothetical protein